MPSISHLYKKASCWSPASSRQLKLNTGPKDINAMLYASKSALVSISVMLSSWVCTHNNTAIASVDDVKIAQKLEGLYDSTHFLSGLPTNTTF
jgi:hypothetical protein